MAAPINWNDFEKIDIRAGTILHAEAFPQAKKRAYILTIDFGNAIGVKRSSAQITSLYSLEQLIGQQVIAVMNFPPKQIATFMSECLVLGIYNENNEVILIQPQRPVSNGLKIG